MIKINTLSNDFLIILFQNIARDKGEIEILFWGT